MQMIHCNQDGLGPASSVVIKQRLNALKCGGREMVGNAEDMRRLRLKYSANRMQCGKRRAMGVGILSAMRKKSTRNQNKDPEDDH